MTLPKTQVVTYSRSVTRGSAWSRSVLRTLSARMERRFFWPSTPSHSLTAIRCPYSDSPSLSPHHFRQLGSLSAALHSPFPNYSISIATPALLSNWILSKVLAAVPLSQLSQFLKYLLDPRRDFGKNPLRSPASF